jgi:hypothetical protein
LLAAGANSRVLDNCNRNVIHTLLASLGEPLADVKLFQTMLALFKKQEIKEMLLEKASLPGTEYTSLTPLAYWMTKKFEISRLSNNENQCGKTDILAVLTAYSEGADLELIDGGGDLPLHKVSFRLLLLHE